MKKIAFLCILVLPLICYSQQVEKTFLKNGEEMYYLIYTPEGYYSSAKTWPLVVFLHGSGERGKDHELLRKHGPPKNAEDVNKNNLPFLILSPQLASKNGWWQISDLSKLLDLIVREYKVDEKRIYLTGLSMGGYGTWAWAFEEPERFAALAPICGGGDPLKVEKIKNVPVWVFHGARDNVVKIDESQKMVNALNEIEGDIRFTVYPTLGHVSWNEAYDSGILYEWFLKQEKE